MSTLQTGDEDSPELIEENEDIEVVETPLRMERSMLESPLPFNVDAADLYCERRNWVNTFDLYALASELTKKDDLFQRATLLYCLGPAVQIPAVMKRWTKPRKHWKTTSPQNETWFPKDISSDPEDRGWMRRSIPISLPLEN